MPKTIVAVKRVSSGASRLNKFTLKFPSKIKKAFTLAEVLVTLTIIGVVSAMTIPTLHQRNTEQATINKVKKFYSTLSQAYQKTIIEYGTPEEWPYTGNSKNDTLTIFNYLIKNNFKIMTDCGFDNAGGCIYDGNYSYLNGNSHWNYAKDTSRFFYKVLLNDGSAIFFTEFNNPNNEHISFYIDVNGPNLPNQFGKDLFSFAIRDGKILPSGSKNTAYEFDKNCKRTKEGIGCTIWVIHKGNMDYLHCDDLSWNGKQKCGK